jgi:anaerobic magnesium-protoporphyrin IX monomethyl ester cyclase
MKIVLVLPSENIRIQYNLSNNVKVNILPPLGVCYLASVLQKAGHAVSIIDATPLNLSIETLTEKILFEKPDMVGLSLYTYTADIGLSLAKSLKLKTSIPIIVGGAHATALPRYFLNPDTAIDVVVIGEGEETLLDLVENWKKDHWSKSLNEIKGIAFRNNFGKIIINDLRKPVDMEKIPFPARELLDHSLYIQLPYVCKRPPVTNIATSRHCPHGKCTYCSVNINSKSQYRRFSTRRVITEIKFLIDKYGIKEFYFWDEVFTVNEEWVVEFCSLLLQEGIDIAWTCYGRINLVTQKMLQAMAKAGCWYILYGIESGNQMLLDKVEKGINLNDVRRVISWTKESGIEVMDAFQFGLPGETAELAEETIKFAMKLNLDYAHFSFTTPFPGTKLYKSAREEGILKSDFSKYTIWEPIFIPKGYFSEKELIAIHRKAFIRFYFRPVYFLRFIARKIRNINDLKRYSSGLVKLFLEMRR